MIKYILICGLILLINSCSTPSRIESFFLGNNSHMFFIYKEEYESDELTVFIDYTVRINADKSGYTTCNFTIRESVGEINNACFICGKDTITTDSLKLLFKDYELNEIRYTSSIGNNSTKQLFSNETIMFCIRTSGNDILFEHKSGHKENIEAFRKSILPQM